MYNTESLIKHQVDNEMDMKLSGIDRFIYNNQRHQKNHQNSNTDWYKRIIQELVNPMAKAIQIYLNYYEGKRGKPSRTLTYLKTLTTHEASFITIKVMLDSLSEDKSCNEVVFNLGSKIEDHVRFAGLRQKAKGYVDKIEKSLRQAKSQKYKHRRGVYIQAEKALIKGNLEASEHYKPQPELQWNEWKSKDKFQLGAKLIDIFAENIKFEGKKVIEKYSAYEHYRGSIKEKSMFGATDSIVDWIGRYKNSMQEMQPTFQPCVIPPRDWTGPTEGGYHVSEISKTFNLVKVRKMQHLKKLTFKQMPEVYKAINKLQSVAWQVNPDIHGVFDTVIKLGLEIGIPAKEKSLFPDAPLPLNVKHLQGEALLRALSEEQKENFFMWKTITKSLHEQENERKSKYLKVNRLWAASVKFVKYKNIYFVYTMDFRGRVYAKSDLINPQGDDLSKSLLRFSSSKELGSTGYKWFCINGANRLGQDDITFDERVSYVESISDEIRDIATDPLTYRSWLTADKPWQYLAFCFEWERLQTHIEQGNSVETYKSQLPVNLDGSCSGTQHYSAILRDPVAGRFVNLINTGKPEDIYQAVADVSKLKLEDRALLGDKNEKQVADQLLNMKGGWNRSIAKKPTMTITYGSTFDNCKKNMKTYLKDLEMQAKKQAREQQTEYIKPYSFCKFNLAWKTGATATWNSIDEVVVGPRVGMKFIQDVASYVGKAGMHLEYITPTGFLIQQHENDWSTRRVKTQMMGETSFTIREFKNKVNKRKTRTSSAPNFIHGCDAAHLIKYVNLGTLEGIEDIGVVHDDFMTHACYAELSGQLLRDSFVDMYTQNDVLSDFKEQLEELICEEIPVELPKTFGLDLEAVRESEYMFG